MTIEINGMDYERAVTNCGGAEMLSSIINAAYHDGEKKIARLENLSAANDFKNYGIEVHALKSTCASLGMSALSAQFYQHEVAAKKNDRAFIDGDFTALLNNYRAFMDNCKPYLTVRQKIAESDLATLDETEIQNRLNELRGALDNFDDEQSIKIIDGLLSAHLAENLRTALENCRNAVDDFDYQTAKAQL